MASLRLQNLRKEFDMGQIVAVDNLDLTFEDGEFVTVVGPSGCGKTTTLRMIAGLETASEGTIAVGGDVVDGEGAPTPPDKQKTAYEMTTRCGCVLHR